VTEDFPLDQGRAALEAWLDAHGIPEADREGVFRIEIVKTSSGEVLRLLGRSDYEEEASSLS
jgi:hypothetical protein